MMHDAKKKRTSRNAQEKKVYTTDSRTILGEEEKNEILDCSSAESGPAEPTHPLTPSGKDERKATPHLTSPYLPYHIPSHEHPFAPL